MNNVAEKLCQHQLKVKSKQRADNSFTCITEMSQRPILGQKFLCVLSISASVYKAELMAVSIYAGL